ncbi:MAG: helix-turn-helix domain-containing protein [Paracoccaceae bacterium]
MGQHRQLSLEDRCRIARLRGSGTSVRQIASAMQGWLLRLSAWWV